jgi:hypothetical protein
VRFEKKISSALKNALAYNKAGDTSAEINRMFLELQSSAPLARFHSVRWRDSGAFDFVIRLIPKIEVES